MNIEMGFDGRTPAGRTLRPVVALPRQGLPGIVIAAIALFGALALFLALDAQRRKSALPHATNEDVSPFPAPPPLTVPAIPVPQPQVISTGPPTLALQPLPSQGPATATVVSGAPVSTPSQPAYRPAPILETYPPPPVSQPLPTAPAPLDATGSLSEPAVVIDSGTEVAAGFDDAAALASNPSASGKAAEPGVGATSLSISPKRLSARGTTVPTGTLIPAVLETPIDTHRPGMVRAIVSQGVRGFDGKRVLIPRGSRLIGDFQGGQNRVLVTWSRLVLPNGTVLELDSPATDASGGAGVRGNRSGFFLTRFVSTALQTAILVGESLLTQRAGTTVVVAVPAGAATSVAAQGLVPLAPSAPRLTVKQGALINAFVAHDLDFSNRTSGH